MTDLISPKEAELRIDLVNLPQSVEAVPLERALHRVLAVDVFANRSYPPFDRVTMDGIAINVEAAEIKFLQVEKTVFAGDPKTALLDPKNAIEIMTGAVLPDGTNAVIRYEDLVETNEGSERFFSVKEGAKVIAGLNIHKKGSDAPAGAAILRKGTTISPVELGILASEGIAEIPVYATFTIAILSSGDEVITPGNPVLEHQIYRSNSYALMGLFQEVGCKSELFHLSDNKAEASTMLDSILSRFSIVVLSGGVSKGKKDFLPAMLQEKGVRQHFHGVRQRPGKPFWFGVKGEKPVVFALPGNPVSVYFCAIRYVIPWLLKLTGRPVPKTKKVVLAKDMVFGLPLTWYVPVSLHRTAEAWLAEPKPGNGSGDFLNLATCDGFLELPEGQHSFAKGTECLFFGTEPFGYRVKLPL